MIDINNILAKHFTDKLSEDEEALFIAWKNNHKKEYEDLKFIWKNTQILDHKDKFSIREGWNSLEAKLLTREKASFKKHVIYKRAWLIAASILILFSISFPWLWSQSNTNTIVASTIKDVILDDGSVVTLNKDASLSYPKKFEKAKRELTLKGEAFFEVQPDSNRPFKINVNKTKVTVLGTSFYINSTGSNVEVVVKTGKVAFTTDKNEEVMLITGEKAVYKGSEIIKTENKNVNFLSWKTKIVKFENKPLSFILKELQNIYGKSIVVQGDASKCFATIDFEKQELDDALKELQLLFGFKMIVNNDNVLINELDCYKNQRP